MTYVSIHKSDRYDEAVEQMNKMAQAGWTLHTVTERYYRDTPKSGFTFFWKKGHPQQS